MNGAPTLERAASAVAIPIEGAELEATLAVPDGANGVIVFAHGSGSGRHSPRNRYVADQLVQTGFGTLLLDLLTPTEERYDRETADLRFDIDRLATRLIVAIDWLAGQERVAAVVSRGGRPDLAKEALERVSAPTLLIVGERDPQVLDLNAQAADRMPNPATIEVVARAGHLFEEEGALERVAELTADWFVTNLR